MFTGSVLFRGGVKIDQRSKEKGSLDAFVKKKVRNKTKQNKVREVRSFFVGPTSFLLMRCVAAAHQSMSVCLSLSPPPMFLLLYLFDLLSLISIHLALSAVYSRYLYRSLTLSLSLSLSAFHTPYLLLLCPPLSLFLYHFTPSSSPFICFHCYVFL